jgi:modulator of FtsH protease HflC
MRTVIVLGVVATVAGAAWMSLFTVDATEFVYVTEFGRHIATWDGGKNDTDAGLHVRWPWPIQTVRRLDRRLQHFDLPAIELLTRASRGADGAAGGVDKTLTVEAYVCWRIAESDAVDRFVRRMDNFDRAKQLLGQQINNQLGALIGQMRMEDLISTEAAPGPGKDEAGPLGARTRVDNTMEQLRQKLLAAVAETALGEYGIKLVDVRLRRFNHPLKIRDTIFDRIRSEREAVASTYRNEGKRRANDIRTNAQVKIDLLTKDAEKAEKEIRAEAERDAEAIRIAAFSTDPEFFRFWNELEQMKTILGNSRTTLLLSTHRPVFDFLFQPPGAPRMSPGPAKDGKEK